MITHKPKNVNSYNKLVRMTSIEHSFQLVKIEVMLTRSADKQLRKHQQCTGDARAFLPTYGDRLKHGRCGSPLALEEGAMIESLFLLH